jgi:hypothetical protein
MKYNEAQRTKHWGRDSIGLMKARKVEQIEKVKRQMMARLQNRGTIPTRRMQWNLYVHEDQHRARPNTYTLVLCWGPL